MGVFYGNFNPDSTFTNDIGSITRLGTSAPFGRYLQEEIFQTAGRIVDLQKFRFVFRENGFDFVNRLGRQFARQ